MKFLKNTKGITLITLMIYIVLTLFVMGILGVLTSNFRNNLNNIDAGTVYNAEFDKLNLRLLKEKKDMNNKIDTALSNETKIVFTNGNVYEYNTTEQAILLKTTSNNIKVASNVEECTFRIDLLNDRQILTLNIKIEGKIITKEYVI